MSSLWFTCMFLLSIWPLPFLVIAIHHVPSLFNENLRFLLRTIGVHGSAIGLVVIYGYMVGTEMALVQAFYPSIVKLHQVIPFTSFRYHRSHISHMRIDRFERLLTQPLFTVFVEGATTTIPILVLPSTTVTEIKEYLIALKALPSDFWYRKAGYLVIPRRFKPLLGNETLQSLGLGPLSMIQLRFNMRGGAQDDGIGKRKRKDAKFQAALQAEHESNSPRQQQRKAKPKIRGGKSSNSGRQKFNEESTSQSIPSLVQQIARLTRSLPDSLPTGLSDGKIAVSLDTDAESAWATFNKFFDRAFGEDTRDSSGRLRYLTRGTYGMDFVNRYLSSVVDDHLSDADFPHDLAIGKLIRLRNELRYLAGNNTTSTTSNQDVLDSGNSEDDEDYIDRPHRDRSSSAEVAQDT
ncbi:hypothetical protein F5878DRAFT_646546, partial [Lentinula raphanica]